MGIELVIGAIALGSAAASQVQQRKAAKAQRQGQENILQQERKRAEVENVRKIRQQIREQRIAQGSLANQAALTGGIGGSAVAGATSSASAQTAGNVSYMQDVSEINTNINNIQLDTANRVASATTSAATFGAIGQLSGTVFSDMGGFKTVFGGNNPPKY